MARSQTWEEQLAGGPLNQAVLEQLRESFDTYRLLDAVDAVDAIRYRLCEPDQVRDDLPHLHDVASALINGGGLNGRRPRQPMWSLAGDLSLELGDLEDRHGRTAGFAIAEANPARTLDDSAKQG